MKKLDNFLNSLSVLSGADFVLAGENEIYRMGVIGQFQLTFELCWKAVQEIMRLYAVSGAEGGSPREILKLAYGTGFLNDQEVWLLMLRKRNTSAHIYDEDAADELVILIRDSFLKAFRDEAEILKEKAAEVEE